MEAVRENFLACKLDIWLWKGIQKFKVEVRTLIYRTASTRSFGFFFWYIL